MSRSDDQRIIINDLAGHLLDAHYALLGLPNLSRHNRFMISLDLSFFCRVERAAPVADAQFREYIRTMLEPFISPEWADSFGFADEMKVLPTKEHPFPAALPSPRFDAFVAQFSNALLPVFRGLEKVLDPHRPRMVSNPPRPSDTEVPDVAMQAMADYLWFDKEAKEHLGAALPPEWRQERFLLSSDQPKFIVWQRPFNIYKHKPLPANAYIVMYLPHRLLQGLSELRQTFTS